MRKDCGKRRESVMAALEEVMSLCNTSVGGYGAWQQISDL